MSNHKDALCQFLNCCFSIKINPSICCSTVRAQSLQTTSLSVHYQPAPCQHLQQEGLVWGIRRQRKKFHIAVVNINICLPHSFFCLGASLCISYLLCLDCYSLQSSDGCYLLVIQISVSVSSPCKKAFLNLKQSFSILF